MTSRSEKDHPLLAAALAYAARGWKVFPLRERDKKPITKTGFKEATNVRSEVLRWWQMYPQANIGLATGDPFDVLDIDGADGVPALQDVLGADYRHAGPVARTGKGAHLYFRAVKGASNRAGLFGGKVDYRGTGGYVVAPPSVHPSGRVYAWDADRGYSLDPPVLPPALLDSIAKRPALERKGIVLRLPTSGGTVRLVPDKSAKIALERPSIFEVVEKRGGVITYKGENAFTNCFFHHDPGPSMALYPDDDHFHCFGCEAHGDSLNLMNGKDMYGRPVR